VRTGNRWDSEPERIPKQTATKRKRNETVRDFDIAALRGLDTVDRVGGERMSMMI